MDKYEELFHKIIVEGNYRNIRFDDARYFMKRSGFSERNNGGDHFRYSMAGIAELINLQPDKRDHKMAKDYQIKQIAKLFRKYKIGGESNGQ